jgi:uncharacterized protein YndB with AHSA1/START domain
MIETDQDSTIVKEITINAPSERIFQALADPAQRIKWWGVEGKFQVTEMESDLRVGGAWVMRGTSMGNRPFTLHGEYRAIDPPRLLEFTLLHEAATDDLLTVVRFDLDEKDRLTTVRLTHSGLISEQSRKNYQGWPWLLSLLKGYVEA